MACRPEPEQWFKEELALISGRLYMHWNSLLSAWDIMEHGRDGREHILNRIKHNQQHRGTLRDIRLANMANDSWREETRRRMEVQDVERRRRGRDLADRAGREVADIAARVATPTFGYNAPRIGDGPLRGAYDRLVKELP